MVKRVLTTPLDSRKQEKQNETLQQLALGLCLSSKSCTAKRICSRKYSRITMKPYRSFRLLEQKCEWKKTGGCCQSKTRTSKEIGRNEHYMKRFGSSPTDNSSRSASLARLGPKVCYGCRNIVLQVNANCVCTVLANDTDEFEEHD